MKIFDKDGDGRVDKEVVAMAIACEVLLVLGIDFYIINHQFENSQGFGAISSIGVIVVSVIACFSLHGWMVKLTTYVKGWMFGIWVVLTAVMVICAMPLYKHNAAKHQNEEIRAKNLAAVTAIEDKKAANDKAKVRDLSAIAEGMPNQRTARQIIASSTREKKGVAALEQAETEKKALASVTSEANIRAWEAGTAWEWLYNTGVHSLPIWFGVLGLFAFMFVRVSGRQAEVEAERKLRASAGASLPRRTTGAGFAPEPMSARDRDELPNS